MDLDKQKNISGEWGDSELGAETGVPPKYHDAALTANGVVEDNGFQGIPVHPVTKPDENEEQVLGI
ncbi:MAG: hypothetical protein COA45_07560 [Zetaproteobacteria bacterium]|nr:MAG: hypothetical protein COA45_07560 [Zetaproteobacteria bacterium]